MILCKNKHIKIIINNTIINTEVDNVITISLNANETGCEYRIAHVTMNNRTANCNKIKINLSIRLFYNLIKYIINFNIVLCLFYPSFKINMHIIYCS